MSDYVNEGVADPWREPGVRLTEQSQPENADSELLAGTLPVFIGWTTDTGPVVTRYIDSQEALSPVKDSLPPLLRYCVAHYFDNGGGPCWLCVCTMPAGKKGFSQKMNNVFTQASSALAGITSLTLVAVPQLTGDAERLCGSSGSDDDHVTALTDAWNALLTVFASRRELFFVLDAPPNPDVVKQCLITLKTNNTLGAEGSRAALYGPHLVTTYQTDKSQDDHFIVLPPCGAVLGVYARTDAGSGIWKAPANEVLSHVVRPQYPESAASGWFNDTSVSVNLIRSFAGRGTRVWGCRTLAGDKAPPFRYVQVRRTVTWIEANLRAVCRFAVFEPNHDVTWFQLRGLCRAWLRRLWLEGGLAGDDEASAYTVRVGLNESMTAADIAAGRLIIRVGVAVLHPAEFIGVTLVMNTGDAPVHAADLTGDDL